MDIVCHCAAWGGPILLIAELPIASPASRLMVWIVCDMLSAILACTRKPKDGELPYVVYLSAACGLIAMLVIAGKGF